METTLNQKPYETIRRRFFRGELPPGSRLVNRTPAAEIDSLMGRWDILIKMVVADTCGSRRKLLCALRSHDAETASDLVRTQLETGRKAVLSFFDSNL